MISWWFGARWFGFLGSPCERDCYLGLIPKIIRNHRAQTTSLPSVEKNLWTKSITFPTKGGHGSLETLPTESCPETLSAAEDHPWSVPKGGCIFLKASHIKQRLHTSFHHIGWMDGVLLTFPTQDNHVSMLFKNDNCTFKRMVHLLFSKKSQRILRISSRAILWAPSGSFDLTIWGIGISASFTPILHVQGVTGVKRGVLAWAKEKQQITYAQQGRPARMMMNS